MSNKTDRIKERIDSLLTRDGNVVVAIDGSCTAGKTTLAAYLEKEYDCNLIHMDDFFLRPQQRTPERYAEAGGNVDYERFREEVLENLLAGKAFSYRPYNCSTGTLKDPVQVQPKKLTIVEGTYSQHPYFGDCYDLRIYLQVSEELREERIRKRPPFLHQRFFEEWIPMEQLYFKTFAIGENSDLSLDLNEET